MKSLELAIQAAEKGLAWLKESGPIYGLDVNQVDVSRLSVRSRCNCVLGQLGQEYGVVMESLIQDGVIGPDLWERVEWSAEHGFDKGFPAMFDYATLDEAWRHVLAVDRAQ